MTDPGQLSLFGMESEAAAPRQARFWSWNPWHGCTKVSPGCQYCYVYRNDARYGTVAASSVCRKNADFDLPLRRGRNGAYKIPSGATVMTSFTSDFLLADADEWRADCFRMMRSRSDLHFVFFTKRIERLSAFLPDDWEAGYDNVTIGCTCEDQIRADMRLPLFLALPIRRRWIVAEPLLTPLSLLPYLTAADAPIAQVTVGGESGEQARLCEYDWVLSIREQCLSTGVPFSYHQTGARLKKDGREYRIPRKLQQIQAKKAGLDTLSDAMDRSDDARRL